MGNLSKLLLSDTAIRCRGLFVPYREIDAALSHSVRPLIFENDCPAFLYARSGSCALLCYRGTYLAIFTKHQSLHFDLNATRVMQAFAGGASLAFDATISVNPDSGEEYEDVCAIRVARAIHRDRSDLASFFPINDIESAMEEAHLFIAIGLPTHLSLIDYDAPHIHAETVTLPCQYAGTLLGPQYVHKLTISRLSPEIPEKFELDGMSGGAVFSIDGNLGAYETNFRGIIVRGGRDQIYIVDAAFVRRLFMRISS